MILLSVIDNPVVAELGSSLISVVIMKERAGQVRGALNGAFASKSSDAAQYTAINGYIESGRYAERSALMTMSDELRNSLSQMKNNSVWQSVVNTQQSYLNQKATLDKLQGPAPQEWFSTATEQIKLINQLRNSIQTQMIDLFGTIPTCCQQQMVNHDLQYSDWSRLDFITLFLSTQPQITRW